MTTEPTILETHEVSDPAARARDLSTLLAAECGYSSTLRRVARGYLVIASDNRAILFRRAPRRCRR
jgi:hypothetical protein